MRPGPRPRGSLARGPAHAGRRARPPAAQPEAARRVVRAALVAARRSACALRRAARRAPQGRAPDRLPRHGRHALAARRPRGLRCTVAYGDGVTRPPGAGRRAPAPDRVRPRALRPHARGERASPPRGRHPGGRPRTHRWGTSTIRTAARRRRQRQAAPHPARTPPGAGRGGGRGARAPQGEAREPGRPLGDPRRSRGRARGDRGAGVRGPAPLVPPRPVRRAGGDARHHSHDRRRLGQPVELPADERGDGRGRPARRTPHVRRAGRRHLVAPADEGRGQGNGAHPQGALLGGLSGRRRNGARATTAFADRTGRPSRRW